MVHSFVRRFPNTDEVTRNQINLKLRYCFERYTLLRDTIIFSELKGEFYLFAVLPNILHHVLHQTIYHKASIYSHLK